MFGMLEMGRRCQQKIRRGGEHYITRSPIEAAFRFLLGERGGQEPKLKIETEKKKKNNAGKDILLHNSSSVSG